MPQNSGSQLSGALNDAKERAAGRNKQNPQLNPALDPDNSVEAKGKTGGASANKEGADAGMQAGTDAPGVGASKKRH